jgi:hypothetical protein
MLTPEEKANFETLRQAFRNNDVALAECMVKASGKRAVVVCVVNRSKKHIAIAPFVRFFEGDPLEILTPPKGIEPLKDERTDGDGSHAN